MKFRAFQPNIKTIMALEVNMDTAEYLTKWLNDNIGNSWDLFFLGSGSRYIMLDNSMDRYPYAVHGDWITVNADGKIAVLSAAEMREYHEV